MSGLELFTNGDKSSMTTQFSQQEKAMVNSEERIETLNLVRLVLKFTMVVNGWTKSDEDTPDEVSGGEQISGVDWFLWAPNIEVVMVNVVRNGRKWGRRLSVLEGFDGAGGLPAWVEEILEAGAVDLYVDNSGFVWSGRFPGLGGGDSSSRSCCFVCGQQWLTPLAKAR